MYRLVLSAMFMICIFFPFTNLFAQDEKKLPASPPITAADFEQKDYGFDTSAHAVILSDIGETEFKGNKHAWFDYIFKRRIRTKIIDKNGYGAATIIVNLYNSEKLSEDLSDVKGITYNLEDGKVVSTELDAKTIYELTVDKNHKQKKFSFPGIKEGSIIELSYTITSPYDFELQPWYFQHLEYPVLWSEYKITMPGALGYAIVKHGIDSFCAQKSSSGFQKYYMENIIGQPMTVSSTTTSYDWAMKNISALKIENYISTPLNYIDELEFQLASTYNGEEVNDELTTWNKTTISMLRDPDFGGKLDELVATPSLRKQISDNEDKLSIAKKVFYFIKDNFSCTSHDRFYVNTDLQDIVKKNSGNVGELNLLLINKLRSYDIPADPMILSTRDNGFSSYKFPLIEKFNYLVCRARINGDLYYLDASHSNLGFGKLTADCYNDLARVISEYPDSVNLVSDSLKERKVTVATVTNADSGMQSEMVIYPGYNESFDIRNKLGNSKQQDFFDNIQKEFSFPAEIKNTSIKSLEDLEVPLTINYTINFTFDNDTIIYFNPVLSGSLKENPFKATTRVYPVEMPYKEDQTYIINMEKPKGYYIDEIPKSVRINLNETDGMFEYISAKTETGFQIRCRILLNKATFYADDYQNLRNFFAYIVKKEDEQVVFKKNK